MSAKNVLTVIRKPPSAVPNVYVSSLAEGHAPPEPSKSSRKMMSGVVVGAGVWVVVDEGVGVLGRLVGVSSYQAGGC